MRFHIRTQVPYTQDDFKLLRDAIYAYAGIFISDDCQGIFMRRLERRLLDLGLDCFRDYYYQLKYTRDNHAELQKLMDTITIKETYFFRELDQMKTLVNEIIPALRKEKAHETIKIWSAGCATGEEAYTLSMLCIERGFHKGPGQVKIFANDISQQAIHKAKQGIYRQSSFRATDTSYLTRFFHPQEEDGTYKIHDEVKEPLTFFCINLMDKKRLAFLPVFDVIFCRNLLIYFDHDSKRQLIENFHKKLQPKRYLFLGHSESIINFTHLFKLQLFKLQQFHHSLVYQRTS
ncbi:chemotaxis protein CheR [candidate division KSB3 bacterium]|uniref:protein-glutamate O-methyltransferase n=1 Tax=candidate division KSB3 bacterium TaxID=2044937 RepID=A0A2G6E9T4_9BACT|nr:MAG: chemotaxis protein CheR [candidate division KSB3 bacterium]PIE30900.1 MAG: chemotaxis protein CheR [candidate division KSB3 bacterium]